MTGPVEVLWGLNLIAMRALYGGSDFVLAGPMNLWLRGLYKEAKPYLILVSSNVSAGRLSEVLGIGATSVEWEDWWMRVEGRVMRARLRNMDVAVLADPSFTVRGRKIKYRAEDLARRSSIVMLGESFIRLAPLDFEEALWEGLGGRAVWSLEEALRGGLGGAASK